MDGFTNPSQSSLTCRPVILIPGKFMGPEQPFVKHHGSETLVTDGVVEQRRLSRVEPANSDPNGE